MVKQISQLSSAFHGLGGGRGGVTGPNSPYAGEGMPAERPAGEPARTFGARPTHPHLTAEFSVLKEKNMKKKMYI